MNILALIREDLQNARTHDPASRGDLENALVYSGLHAIWAYRVFHAMWQIPVLRPLARVGSQIALLPALKFTLGPLLAGVSSLTTVWVLLLAKQPK